MDCLLILSSLRASNPEETKTMLPSLIKMLRVDRVYAVLKNIHLKQK